MLAVRSATQQSRKSVSHSSRSPEAEQRNDDKREPKRCTRASPTNSLGEFVGDIHAASAQNVCHPCTRIPAHTHAAEQHSND